MISIENLTCLSIDDCQKSRDDFADDNIDGKFLKFVFLKGTILKGRWFVPNNHKEYIFMQPYFIVYSSREIKAQFSVSQRKKLGHDNFVEFGFFKNASSNPYCRRV